MPVKHSSKKHSRRMSKKMSKKIRPKSYKSSKRSLKGGTHKVKRNSNKHRTSKKTKKHQKGGDPKINEDNCVMITAKHGLTDYFAWSKVEDFCRSPLTRQKALDLYEITKTPHNDCPKVLRDKLSEYYMKCHRTPVVELQPMEANRPRSNAINITIAPALTAKISSKNV
jgi:hypothetical protein